MPQTFVQPNDIQNSHFVVRGREAHHLIHVLRKQVNDAVDLFDGTGHQYEGILTDIQPQAPSASGHISKTLAIITKLHQIHLYQGLPKGSKFDFVIEKATEVGVDSITPFLSEKNVIRLRRGQVLSHQDLPPSLTPSHRQERWQKVALAAAKQCGRADIPALGSIFALKDLENRFRSHPTLVLAPGAKQTQLKSLFINLKEEWGTINVVVGPESGLSENELKWFAAMDAHLVALGENILRTETAGLILISILRYEFNMF